jgi:hypothetical protein
MDVSLRTLLACLLVLCASAVCQAVPNNNFANAKTRDIVGGRKVLITVIQGAIQPTIYPPGMSNVYVATYRGVRKTVIDKQALEQQYQLTMAALQDCVPIIEATYDYEFNAPLQAALRPAVTSSAWLRAQDVEFSEHGTTDFVLDKLDQSNTRQMLLLYTNYYTSPDFSAIVVDLQISLLVRKISKGTLRASRVNPEYIPYRQTIRSRVVLANADLKDRKKNVERWAANHGRLARQAFDSGIAALATLAPLAIELNAEQAKDWRSRGKRKTQQIEGVFGWVRERDADGILMIDARDGAWTRIRTVSPN